MRRTALLAIALSGLLAAPAAAHDGNPDFESLVTAVDGAPGVKAEILNGDDRLLVVNEGTRTVIVAGYDDEPYARLHPDGRVEVNQRSEAASLNEDRFGDAPLPAQADNAADPRWTVVARNGRFEFHDHRVHWMSKTDPPQVTDKSRRTRISDWTVPLRVEGGGTGTIRGTLWWVGDGGGAPTVMFAGLGIFALLSVALAVVVRRRRRGGAGEAAEAW